MPKNEARNTIYWIYWEVNSLVDSEIWPVYVRLQKKIFHISSTKIVAWKLKYHFLFIALIFWSIVTLNIKKKLNKIDTVGKPRPSRVSKWKIFWKNKNWSLCPLLFYILPKRSIPNMMKNYFYFILFHLEIFSFCNFSPSILQFADCKCQMKQE